MTATSSKWDFGDKGQQILETKLSVDMRKREMWFFHLPTSYLAATKIFRNQERSIPRWVSIICQKSETPRPVGQKKLGTPTSRNPPKTRSRDSWKTLPRSRDQAKIFRDPRFSRWHSIPLTSFFRNMCGTHSFLLFPLESLLASYLYWPKILGYHQILYNDVNATRAVIGRCLWSIRV